jgi:hypothetical protein
MLPRVLSRGEITMHIRTIGAPVLAVALVTALTGTPAAAATATFGAPTDLTTGGVPVAIATGDLNGDGRPDLAVANEEADTISVLLNRRGTGFRTVPEIATGGNVFSVAIADVDGDRRPDLIGTAADIGVSRVVIAPGRGDGRFRAPRVLETGADSAPLRVVAADLDGDADVDLAVTLAARQQIQVFRNDGRGRFTPGAALVTNPSADAGLATGDLNGDGHLDLIATGGGYGRVVTFLGAGDGTFGPAHRREITESLSPVVLADYTSDDRPDVIAPLTEGGALLLPGNGDGTFGEAAYVSVYATVAATAGDFDADGRADVAFSSRYGSAVVMLGNGDGTFQEQSFLDEPGSPGVPAAADLTGDGRDDLLLPNTNRLTFTVRFYPSA